MTNTIEKTEKYMRWNLGKNSTLLVIIAVLMMAATLSGCVGSNSDSRGSHSESGEINSNEGSYSGSDGSSNVNDGKPDLTIIKVSTVSCYGTSTCVTTAINNKGTASAQDFNAIARFEGPLDAPELRISIPLSIVQHGFLFPGDTKEYTSRGVVVQNPGYYSIEVTIESNGNNYRYGPFKVFVR